jgi:hypothetical protein
MDSERRKREKEVERLVNGTPVSRDSEAAFREEVRKTASELFQKETRRIEQDERPATSRKSKSTRLRMWGIGLIVIGAGAIVLEVPALGGLLFVLGVGVFFWDTLARRPEQQRFRSKAQAGRFNPRL